MADKVFIRYLLTTVLFFHFVIVCADGAADPIKVVTLKPDNFNVRSVLIDGKTIDLEKWSSESAAGSDDDKRSKTKYAFVKCECAHFVNASLGTVLRSLEKADSQKAIPLLQQMNEQLKLAIGVLFEIADVHANLKSTEPYLLTTLLSTSFYVNSLTTPSDTTLQNVKRVVLQIQSLAEHFAIQQCNAGLNQDIGGAEVEPEHFQTGLNAFDSFLKTVISWTPTPIDTNRITLKLSLMDSVRFNQSSVLFKLFQKVLGTAKFLSSGEYISVGQGCLKIKKSYDVDAVYKHTYAVYKVLLKTIYELTVRVWEGDQNLGLEWYNETIATLRSMHCPDELMDHFMFAMNVELYRSKGPNAHKLIRGAAIRFTKSIYNMRVQEVMLCESEFVKILDLRDFMEAVFDNELQQFWWAFNLLRRVEERKSYLAYDLSLDLNPEANVHQASKKYLLICKSLPEIYEEFLNVQLAIGDTLVKLRSPSDVTGLISETVRQTHRLLCILIEELNKWEIYDDRDRNQEEKKFTNILLATGILLCREYYNPIEKDSSADLAIVKRDKFLRIIDIFANLLDNYQFRNCPKIKDRNYVYRSKVAINKHMSVRLFKYLLFPREYDPQCTISDIRQRVFGFGFLIQLYNDISLKDYGTGVIFSWNGEMKSMLDIQTDVIENMLDIHDLVHYQLLYINWSFRILYQTYIYYLNDLEMLKRECDTPKLIREYVEYLELKLIFFKTVHNDGDLNVLKKEIISTMADLLGIVKEDGVTLYKYSYREVTDIYDELTIETNPKSIYFNIQRFYVNIIENFIFLY